MDDLADLIPHRPPMVLLDRVVSHDDASVTCAVVIRAGAPFVRDGEVAAVVSVEYMAQAAAALLGIQGRLRGLPVRPGVLLGARELVLDVDAFAVGDALTVHARHMWGEERWAVIDGEVRRDGVCLARATLSVLREADEPA